jgi:hypothetical protein
LEKRLHVTCRAGSVLLYLAKRDQMAADLGLTPSGAQAAPTREQRKGQCRNRID